jgi:hypothetical protein
MSKQMTILACSLAMAACAPTYVYRPATNATATIKGRVAADYPIPPAAPKGDVRLASFGMSDISPNAAAFAHQKAIHVRMIVADNSQTAWTLDTRQQVVALPDGQQLAPAYVATRDGQGGLPSVTVAAGSKRIIDLFYPLSPAMQSASRVPEFDVVWRVDTPEEQVTERTPFDRLQIEPATAYGDGPEWGAWDDGWGGPFWHDPMYPGYGGAIFVGAPHWGDGKQGRGGHEEGHGGHEAFGGHGRR